MNSITRFVAPASTTMPSTEISNSAWYSPCPASAAANERIESSVAASAPAANTIVSASVRLSIASAPETTSSLSSHCHTPSPTATPSVTTVSSGTSTLRTNAGRSSPAISTMQAPTVSATSGEIAAQSICGPFIFTTCWIAALVAGSDAVSAPCGYSANAMIASTSGTITTASAHRQLTRLDARRRQPVVHRADEHPQHVDRRHHHAGERDDRDRQLGLEQPEQDQELADEVRRARASPASPARRSGTARPAPARGTRARPSS